MAITRRTTAWLNLAYRFGVHVLVRLPGRAFRRSIDAQRFRDEVVPEGYVPLLPEERDALPLFMNCIHCGLCSLACPELRAVAPADAAGSAWAEPWTFVGGPSRSIDRAPIVAAGLAACASCRACADICPTGVPIPRMAAAVQRLAADSIPAAPPVS